MSTLLPNHRIWQLLKTLGTKKKMFGNLATCLNSYTYLQGVYGAGGCRFPNSGMICLKIRTEKGKRKERDICVVQSIGAKKQQKHVDRSLCYKAPKLVQIIVTMYRVQG